MALSEAPGNPSSSQASTPGGGALRTPSPWTQQLSALTLSPDLESHKWPDPQALAAPSPFLGVNGAGRSPSFSLWLVPSQEVIYAELAPSFLARCLNSSTPDSPVLSPSSAEPRTLDKATV